MLTDGSWALQGRWPPAAIALYALGVAGFTFFGFYSNRGESALGLSRETTWFIAIGLVAATWALAITLTARARRRRSA